MALALKSWIRERISTVPTASEPLADFPELRRLLTIWRHAWVDAGRQVPDRRLMDPVNLPRPLLPSMFIYEREGERFRCRLAGSRLREVFGHAMEGRYLDDMVKPESAPRRNAIFNTVLEEGKPLIYSGFLVAEGKEWRYFRRLLLPMRKQAGGPVDQIMGAVHFCDPPPGLRQNPHDPDGQIILMILEPQPADRSV
ncbi:PAS domain-containing protein [Niveispirillum sp. SYP-B3756]|uniref:PAS domain-containing protein n=1 Tax=Niveispirillum sp. SYP-B3756 TaxID=2662178 RepID=UPI0015679F5D|nr:PAS domain-containing protein [Niveispirillum sp. SYP-B3756]